MGIRSSEAIINSVIVKSTSHRYLDFVAIIFDKDLRTQDSSPSHLEETAIQLIS
ncbi:hypothetical protein HanPSC8_Chr04g0181111 [Helianthus annuus]|nr:hypothetical protein HanPSC8_Chr04g0181111 [Helianthus annuus]